MPNAAASPAQVRSLLTAAGLKIPELSLRLDRDGTPLHGFPVPGAQAVATWKQVRAATAKTGFYPLIVADMDDFSGIDDPEWYDEFPAGEKALDLADKIKGAEWIEEALERALATAEEVGIDDPFEPGEWPEDVEPATEFVIPLVPGSEQPRDNVAILLLPTKEPWQAAAWMGFASPNFDITPQEHAAVHKYWHERFGAEPIACDPESFEFLVKDPPVTKNDALALGRAMFAYCPDIVDQGTGSIDSLAALILKGSAWFFWWD